MTASEFSARVRRGGGIDRHAARLAALLDPGFLTEAGWDPALRVLSPPPGHRLLGRTVCRVEGCSTTATDRTRICTGCRQRLAEHGLSEDEIASLPSRAAAARPGSAARCPAARGSAGVVARCGLCRIPRGTAAPRWGSPSRSSCADPRARPLPALRAVRGRGVHAAAPTPRRRLLRDPPAAVARAAADRPGRGRAPLAARPNRRSAEAAQVSLRGLPPLVIVAGAVRPAAALPARRGQDHEMPSCGRSCDELRRAAGRPRSTTTSRPPDARRQPPAVVTALARHARRALADPGHRDRPRTCGIWRCSATAGRLSFTGISQPWLRAGGQAVGRRGTAAPPRSAGGGPASGCRAPSHRRVARLSETPARRRPDHGRAPRGAGPRRHRGVPQPAGLPGVDRADQPRPPRSGSAATSAQVLARIRALGLTRPGRPAAGLAGDFTLGRGDIPAEPERGEPGRDLPAGDHGAALRAPGRPRPSPRDPGRDRDGHRHRPPARGDPATCRWTAWPATPTALPVLVYDNDKADRPRPPAADQRGHRRGDHRPAAAGPGTLPAHPGRRAETAAHHRAQPRRAPGRSASPACSTAPPRLGRPLPVLRTRDGTEFDKTKIVPYAYRHTYAQRHADAGVPIDVLRRAARSPQHSTSPAATTASAKTAAAPPSTRVTALQLRPARQPDLARRPGAAGLRTRPPRRRRGRRPLRQLHRTVQRQGRRRRLPGPVPLRRLRPLPHRRLLPARPAGLPRRPAAHPGTAGRRHRRHRRLGPRRRHPHRARRSPGSGG